MDRTAWIAIALCVLGLIAWEIWIARQPLPPPAVATAPSAPPLASGIPATSAPSAVATPVQQAGTAATSGPSATPAQFEEKTETLRNSDVELNQRSSFAQLPRGGRKKRARNVELARTNSHRRNRRRSCRSGFAGIQNRPRSRHCRTRVCHARAGDDSQEVFLSAY